MLSRWPVGRFGFVVFMAAFFAVAVTAADAKQLTIGHADIYGKNARLNLGERIPIFKHKNFATVDFICGSGGGGQAPNAYELRVTNMTNHTLWVTYTGPGTSNLRHARPIEGGGSSRIENLRDPDVGLTDDRHKYATLDIDWGRQENEDGSQGGREGCVLASHTILHFPDGTPLNADHIPGSARK